MHLQFIISHKQTKTYKSTIEKFQLFSVKYLMQTSFQLLMKTILPNTTNILISTHCSTTYCNINAHKYANNLFKANLRGVWETNFLLVVIAGKAGYELRSVLKGSKKNLHG